MTKREVQPKKPSARIFDPEWFLSPFAKKLAMIGIYANFVYVIEKWYRRKHWLDRTWFFFIDLKNMKEENLYVKKLEERYEKWNGLIHVNIKGNPRNLL